MTPTKPKSTTDTPRHTPSLKEGGDPPTTDRIQDALYGFTRSQLLFTAVELDLFTRIDAGVLTATGLQQVLQVDPRALRIFLDGLVGIGFLRKAFLQDDTVDTSTREDAHYTLPEDVQRYLSRKSPWFIGGMVQHCKGLSENWALLTDVVRTGSPSGRAYGLEQLESSSAALVKGLYVTNYQTAHKLASLLKIGQPPRQGLHILDVAGGSGVWSMAMLQSDPTAQATLVDYPTVTEVAKQYAEDHQLTNRYQFLPGDLERMALPPQQFDLAVLGNICHALGRMATQKLLANVHQALKPDGEIVIVDFIPDNHRAQPGWPLRFGVNMLVSTPEGNVFTFQQFQEWLTSAGFQSPQQKPLDSEVSLVLGKASLSSGK